MKVLTKDRFKLHDKNVHYFVIEKLKPMIVSRCLEIENYIITDNQAQKLARLVINKAMEDLIEEYRNSAIMFNKDINIKYMKEYFFTL